MHILFPQYFSCLTNRCQKRERSLGLCPCFDICLSSLPNNVKQNTFHKWNCLFLQVSQTLRDIENKYAGHLSKETFLFIYHDRNPKIGACYSINSHPLVIAADILSSCIFRPPWVIALQPLKVIVGLLFAIHITFQRKAFHSCQTI